MSSGFLHKYNTDDVHSRSVIVGLINLLNNKIKFTNVLSDDKIEKISVPWYPQNSTDERFLQDYFTFWNECLSQVSGNYDVVPRGVIKLQSKSVNSDQLVNKFVRGNFVREVDGQLKTYSAFINFAPVTLSFECEIKANSYLELFKIEQSILDVFYRTVSYNINFNGFRLGCIVGFPNDYTINKIFEYSYPADENSNYNLTFNLEVNTHYPIVDDTTQIEYSKRIFDFIDNYNLNPDVAFPQKLTFKNPINQTPLMEFYSDDLLPIIWETIGPINRVKLEYSLDGGLNWSVIEKMALNKNAYVWKIPFFDENKINIIFSEDVIKPAKLRVVVDGTGSISNIIILDGGFGYSNLLNISIEENLNNSAIVSPNVIDGSIVSVDIINPGSGYTPTNIFTVKLKISNFNFTDIYDTVDFKVK